MTPKEIVDYIHEEFTPYSKMRLEESKKHLAELIEQSFREYHDLLMSVALSPHIKSVTFKSKTNDNERTNPESKESCCGSCATGSECGGTNHGREDIIVNNKSYMGPVVGFHETNKSFRTLDHLPDVIQSPGANFCIGCGEHPTRCRC